MLSKGKTNNHIDTANGACWKISFIKQKSDRYNQRNKSFSNHYSNTLALLAVEMLAFLGMAQAPHGLHFREVRARG
jgi:hypothetical protein